MLNDTNVLNDSELEEVNGGAGNGHNYNLPLHACVDGGKGELIPLGGGHDNQGRARGRYRCSLCNKVGTVYFLPGTSKLCDLV